ncbi:MAG TPA: hypothetical protein DIV79_13690 [Opitutae bacterium]|nr:hypothetical protein [Opitutaceae bacterium]HCR31060.1 hypothetical protein [Opitutae bacterium]
MKLSILNLEREAPRSAKLGFWPFVDICVIGLFASLYGSNFVIAPGINIELPQSNHVQSTVAQRLQVMSVDEVGGEEQIYFEDRLLKLETLEKMLRLRGEVPENVTLLIRMDGKVSAQTIASIYEIAMAVGYRQVLWATENRPEESNALDAIADE